ncbi:MAG: corrinoid protein [Nitrososphaerota archaeon]|nr:corrinoid protein [Nitrososphaerales archaeon]MDW8044510.1 corrinoid protein [Nitrososphaerota archaeon]
MDEDLLDEIFISVAECREESYVLQTVQRAIESNVDPLEIMDAVKRGLDVVGEKYERMEYFLMDLVVAGKVASEVLKLIKPLLMRVTSKPRGKVVIGTVAGDVHDIGKNLVIAMLASAGYEVIDLGVDVPAEKFVEAVRNEKPDIVAMSALLTITLDEQKKVIEALKSAGLRDKVKVMVGGRPVTPEFAKEIGADGYGKDAIEAVKVANTLLGYKK